MTRRPFRSFLPLARAILACALAWPFAAALAPPARACACCAHTAWRNVNVDKLDAGKLEELARVKFVRTAKLMLGEADDKDILGVENAERDYTLAVTRQKDKWIFALADRKGRKGTLTLAMPKTVSVFEVDPREGKDDEKEPVLYKEWKLNANAAGDGMFRKSAGAGQKMTLILHGRGNGCTSAEDFSHWSLLVHGPVDTYTFYGALQRPQ